MTDQALLTLDPQHLRHPGELVGPDEPVRGRRPDRGVRRPAPPTTIEIVVPVYNEETILATSVERLVDYLDEGFPFSWMVTIADNASTDRTWSIACRLATELPSLRAVHLDQKGRGRALQVTWSASEAAVVAYMDVDLSTDLDALLPLVAPLVSGHSDVAIGSRLAAGAQIVRGAKREVISRGYNLILRTALGVRFSDAQCGFKAVRADVARQLLPLVEDQGWFFDTELLVLAERNGLRIHEVPVDWVDDPDSRVDIVGTARGDLKGVGRMMARFARGDGTVGGVTRSEAPAPHSLEQQIVRYASIGVVSTLLFAVLFAVLASPLGTVPADIVALTTCAVVNTAANRRLTFAFQGRAGRVRHHLAGLAVSLLPLGLTLLTLGALDAVGVTSVTVVLALLTVVNLAATTVRFVLLRSWVFRASKPVISTWTPTAA
jgi:putative flippase GtrA